MPRKAKTENAEAVAAVEKAAPKAAEKAPAKAKATPKPATETVFLQFGGHEWDLKELREKAVAAYVAEGHRRNLIKDLVLYIKPEENKVYYVVNGKATGSADLA